MPKTSIDLPAKRYFQTLVFNIGIVSKVPGKPLAKDAIRVGKCNLNDKWLKCTGGCNDLRIGGACHPLQFAKCTAGQMASVEIKCN